MNKTLYDSNNVLLDTRVIDAVIRWKDSKKTEEVRIALYPYNEGNVPKGAPTDDDIFYYCNGEDEFIDLLRVFNGEDFEVIWFDGSKFED